MRRGITLIELLLSLSIVVVVTASSTRALVVAINYDNRLKAGRDAISTRNQFEDRIRDLLHHAWLSSSATDQDSYFIGGTPTLTANSSTQSMNSGTSSATPTTGGSASGGNPNTLTFTAAGLPLNQSFLASNSDFETNNQNFGPPGGISEVSLSTTAVGSTGQSLQGVFLRIQRPADFDPTQGGDEQMIGPGVTQLGFQFFDGQNWQSSWDTQNQTTTGATPTATATPGTAQGPVLPAAVKVTYRFAQDSVDHIIIVRIPSSPANSNNIVTVTG